MQRTMLPAAASTPQQAAPRSCCQGGGRAMLPAALPQVQRPGKALRATATAVSATPPSTSTSSTQAANTKLPASHLESSTRALAQLKEQAVNRECAGWELGDWDGECGPGGAAAVRAGGSVSVPVLARSLGATWTVMPPPLPGSARAVVHHTASRRLCSVSLSAVVHHAGYAGEKKSSIIAIGLTIHSAPVSLREKLAVPEAEWPRAIQELCNFPHIEEAAVLSTCNRMELYLVGLSWHRGVREVEEWLSRTSGVPLDELRPYLFLLRDRDATQHLLRVSGGLDSLVMGEGQILAQVRQVYKVGQNCPGFGRHLNGLFKQAITAGKRVRTETSISTGGVSVSSAAVELAQLKLPTRQWCDARVCIIGAGKMSTLLVKHLQSKGCKEVTVLNRSLPRAQALAEEFPEVSAAAPRAGADAHTPLSRAPLLPGRGEGAELQPSACSCMACTEQTAAVQRSALHVGPCGGRQLRRRAA